MNKLTKKRALRFIGYFAVFFSCCLLITTAYVRNKNQMENAQMEQVAVNMAVKVNNVLTKLLYKTQALAALVIQNDGEVQEFERVAATIFDDPAMRNVILAPGGVVSHVYPVEGNEQVLGFDYFSQMAGNREALAARETGQLVLGGPFELVQGGQALVGRLPVYLGGRDDEHFWGLVSVTLNYPQALDGAELEQLKNNGFAYEIWRISPDTNERQVIANSSYTYNKNARYVEQSMQILNAQWYFRLSPIRSWYAYPETWIFSLAGLCISLLAASLILHNRDLRQVKLELEALTYYDPLTGALNRRGAFRELRNLTAAGEAFLLCFLDLDRFKQINDTFGHSAGDAVLERFTRVFQRLLGPKDFFARIGGDEFLLILRGLAKKEDATALFDRARRAFKEESPSIDTGEISFSLGTAAFPAESADPDELVMLADKAMYQAKTGAPQS